MCGVFGAIGPSAHSLSEKASQALKALRHRGPDAEGFYLDPKSRFFLGHTRLSILDLSKRSNQPMIDRNNVIAYNGEIYNHLLLRSKDRNYETHSDTETILKAENLKTTLSRSIGMFAGAYWNDDQQTLFIFADTMGIKPLFYATLSDSTLVFASEEKTLLDLAGIPAIGDLDCIKSYLAFENFKVDSCFFKNINRLAPGSFFEISYIRNVVVKRESLQFQDDFDQNEIDSFPDAAAIAGLEIRKSVERHLLSDTSVAVYLSGGIDSSLIASLAASSYQKKISGYIGYFDEAGPYDERDLARMVAKKSGIELNEILITSEDFAQNFDPLIFQLGQPRMGFGSFSQKVVAQKVGQSHKVVLSGHGGDELFMGYPYMQAIAKMAGVKTRLNSKSKIFYAYLLSRRILGKPGTFAPIIWDSFADSKNDAQNEFFMGRKKENWLNEQSDYYFNNYIQGLLLVEDKVSMSQSLETRMPLWTQPLASLARKIRPEVHFQNGGKSLLREMAKEILPSELLHAPKRGFPTPLSLWYSKQLRQYAEDQLNSDSTIINLLFKPNQISSLLGQLDLYNPVPALKEKQCHKIWTILCLKSWERQFGVNRYE